MGLRVETCGDLGLPSRNSLSSSNAQGCLAHQSKIVSRISNRFFRGLFEQGLDISLAKKLGSQQHAVQECCDG